MLEEYTTLLQQKLTDESYRKLMAIANPRLHAFVADTVEDAGNRNHTNGTPLGATTDDQCKEHDVAASKDKDKVF